MTLYSQEKSVYQASANFLEKRRNPRIAFTACAEVTELKANARVAGRTADINRDGCYIDAMSSFPAGTPVMVRLTKDRKSFSTTARVIYSHSGMGMSLAFGAIEPEQQWILENWVGEFCSETPDRPEVTGGGLEFSEAKAQAEPIYALKYLILMLVQKSVLNENEGAALLDKFLASSSNGMPID